VDYEYNAANQLTSVTDWLTNETTYAYDDAGRLTTTTYPNGVTDTRTYDDADRLLTVTNAKTGTEPDPVFRTVLA
jgi:YD repeat-containing protein